MSQLWLIDVEVVERLDLGQEGELSVIVENVRCIAGDISSCFVASPTWISSEVLFFSSVENGRSRLWSCNVPDGGAQILLSSPGSEDSSGARIPSCGWFVAMV